MAALREGTDPDRAASRDQDQAAVALLEQRHVTSPAIEARVRELIATAMQLEVNTMDPDDIERYRKVQHAAAQLKAWLRDWRTTASVVQLGEARTERL